MSERWPKCWGSNIEIFKNDSVSVNLLNLVKGGVCSYHFHKCKNNTFYLISGKVTIRTEYGETSLNPGDSMLVRAPIKHRFETLEDSVMIECMWVEYDPKDIVRITQGYREESKGTKDES